MGQEFQPLMGNCKQKGLLSDLSSQGITIISGLARGIDSIAHSAALKNDGRTIAIIGSGIRCYLSS